MPKPEQPIELGMDSTVAVDWQGYVTLEYEDETVMMTPSEMDALARWWKVNRERVLKRYHSSEVNDCKITEEPGDPGNWQRNA